MDFFLFVFVHCPLKSGENIGLFEATFIVLFSHELTLEKAENQPRH